MNHRIREYPELEEKHKGSPNPIPGMTQNEKIITYGSTVQMLLERQQHGVEPIALGRLFLWSKGIIKNIPKPVLQKYIRADVAILVNLLLSIDSKGEIKNNKNNWKTQHFTDKSTSRTTRSKDVPIAPSSTQKLKHWALRLIRVPISVKNRIKMF